MEEQGGWTECTDSNLAIRYEVSSRGQIREVESGRILPIMISKAPVNPSHNGEPYVVLKKHNSEDATKKMRLRIKVKNVVYKTLRELPNGCLVTHHNGDKMDNRIENLALKRKGSATKNLKINLNETDKNGWCKLKVEAECCAYPLCRFDNKANEIQRAYDCTLYEECLKAACIIDCTTFSCHDCRLKKNATNVTTLTEGTDY